MVTKEHILSEIKRLASDNDGQPLGRTRFENETGIKESDWLGKYWTTWSDAITEAGFEPNTMQTAFPIERLLENLVLLIRELERFPTNADLKLKRRVDPNFPSHNAFNRLGLKAERAHRVMEYCLELGNLDDVVALCQPFAKVGSDTSIAENDTDYEVFGFVYLMKSGKYYKIGRSDCAEKRAYEIQLLLPEKLKLVHKIKTDDPKGIERYWHQRFSSKRLRGEWFDLSSQEIKAFRRRKFM